MPESRPVLDLAMAREVIIGLASPRRTGPLVGLEMEWHTNPAEDRSARCGNDQLRRVCDGLVFPGGSRVTYEPGGQVELSGPPVSEVAQACDLLNVDAELLIGALASAGIEVVAAGNDPYRPPIRVLDQPRYAAMEAYFDTDGSAGRRMMCNTAALQVNLDAGPDPTQRWALAHAVGPALNAAFATSPTGAFSSSRMATWFAVDPTRTRSALGAGDATSDWATFALAARVMLVRMGDDTCCPVDNSLTLADWVNHGYEGAWPDEADITYHLTTLFPPIRLRGWLELRFLDSLPAPWWRAAAVTTATVLANTEVSLVVDAVARHHRIGDSWALAARHGLRHPGVAAVARACVQGAAEASGDPVVAEFLERFTSRGRAPGIDAGRCVA